MERLTTNKNVSDMGMLELAHNCCYADDKRNARYRDYDLDIDSRQLVRKLLKDFCEVDTSEFTDEEFDNYMCVLLSLKIDSKAGLLALFYRNLWAMADLREKLKFYEDTEEQWNLLRLPCKVGDEIYAIMYDCEKDTEAIRESKIVEVTQNVNGWFFKSLITAPAFRLHDFGKVVFLTREEAETKLKEMEGQP